MLTPTIFRAIALVPLAMAVRGESLGLLHTAIRNGDLARVQKLVASGADVNEPDDAGTPPLIAAVLSNQLEIGRFVLTHGADVNARQRQTGGTALFYAVSKAQAEFTKTLLAAGARTDLRYRDEQTVLHVAVIRGEAAMAQLLLAQGAKLSDTDAAGNTALDEGVLHGRAEVVHVLLAGGADPNRVHGANARGPLDEAAIAGYAQLAELLIEAGAEPTARDNSGQSALDLALAYKSGGVVRSLLQRATMRPELRQQFSQAMENAVVRGRTVTARLLLDSGWSVNERTSSDSTYLNDAALKGQLGLARMLVEHGADINSRNSQGGTPLHDAAISGNPELINLLLDRGAALEARDTESDATPLMLAASLGNNAAVATLLRRGANPLLVDRSGRSALSRAREGQNSELVKLLENARKSAAKS